MAGATSDQRTMNGVLVVSGQRLLLCHPGLSRSGVRVRPAVGNSSSFGGNCVAMRAKGPCPYSPSRSARMSEATGWVVNVHANATWPSPVPARSP